jgi:hypothetical protein
MTTLNLKEKLWTLNDNFRLKTTTLNLKFNVSYIFSFFPTGYHPPPLITRLQPLQQHISTDKQQQKIFGLSTTHSRVHIMHKIPPPSSYSWFECRSHTFSLSDIDPRKIASTHASSEMPKCAITAPSYANDEKRIEREVKF